MREGAPRGSPLLICLIVAWDPAQPLVLLLLQTPAQMLAQQHSSPPGALGIGILQKEEP